MLKDMVEWKPVLIGALIVVTLYVVSDVISPKLTAIRFFIRRNSRWVHD